MTTKSERAKQHKMSGMRRQQAAKSSKRKPGAKAAKDKKAKSSKMSGMRRQQAASSSKRKPAQGARASARKKNTTRGKATASQKAALTSNYLSALHAKNQGDTAKISELKRSSNNIQSSIRSPKKIKFTG